MSLCALAGDTGDDAKILERLAACMISIQHPRHRGGRCLAEQSLGECLQLLDPTLRVDLDFPAVVSHPTGELEALCQPIDKRAVADALHATADPPAQCRGSL